MDIQDKKKAAPPYVAYKTLRNFLDRFKQGVPGRIDRGLMGTMSGAAQSQVTTALKFLGFISENSIPLDPMKKYFSASEETRKEALAETLKKSYPFLFDEQFDLTTATASQLREQIETNTTASGETVGRCLAFFKEAAIDAGLKVSPFITNKLPRSGGPRKKSSAVRKIIERQSASESNQAQNEPNQPVFEQVEAQSSLLLWGLFKRLPKPGSVWPLDQRDQWTKTLANVLALEYRDH